MSLLIHLRDLFLEFLFPKSEKVIKLESLPVSDLWLTLPPALSNFKNKDVIALFDYQDTLVKEIIWEVKYAGNKVLAKHLGEILYDVITDELNDQNILEKWTSVILIPMPISDKRRRERGWNQSELLTQAIKDCDQRGVFKYLPQELVKPRHTESQTKTANKSERRQNLTDSMKVLNPLSVDGKFVVLIDDVVTTGSTFAEAQRALKVGGAKKILCLAVAH